MGLCEHCNKKKVGVVPFECKCNYKSLCVNCRYPEQHGCSFDFKKVWKDKLILTMVPIVHEKIIKL